MCGPTGIGVLFGRESILESMPPFLGGGDMIRRVSLEGFQSNEIPHKFEAGTPPIAEAIGFGAAVDYLNKIGMQTISDYEHDLTHYALDCLSQIKWLHVFGPSHEYKGGVVSFTTDIAHPHDIAQVLDAEGVAVRAGHHCAMPLHQRLGLPSSTRASIYLYNTREDIDQFIIALQRVKEIFG